MTPLKRLPVPPAERHGPGQLFETESGEIIAQIRVPERQSLELEIGQTAIVDLRIGEARARVTELGDEIVQGIRVVHLEFTGELPERALPGMFSVVGNRPPYLRSAETWRLGVVRS